MQTIIINNCTVELHIPDMLEMCGIDGPRGMSRVELTAREYLYDVLVKTPDGKTITIKKLYLRKLLGTMMAVIDEKEKSVVLFSVVDTPNTLNTNQTAEHACEQPIVVENR